MFCGVVSEYVLEEVARALTLKFGETEAAAEGLLGSLHLAIVPPAATARRMQASRRISDPADVAVLAAALSAKADALVTGDAHFFTPAIQALVPVLTPREALDLLRRPSSGDTRP
jgi:predicted nucleic acid-binding protein